MTHRFIIAALALTALAACTTDHAGMHKKMSCPMMQDGHDMADGAAEKMPGCAMMHKKPAGHDNAAHQHPAS